MNARERLIAMKIDVRRFLPDNFIPYATRGPVLLQRLIELPIFEVPKDAADRFRGNAMVLGFSVHKEVIAALIIQTDPELIQVLYVYPHIDEHEQQLVKALKDMVKPMKVLVIE